MRSATPHIDQRRLYRSQVHTRPLAPTAHHPRKGGRHGEVHAGGRPCLGSVCGRASRVRRQGRRGRRRVNPRGRLGSRQPRLPCDPAGLRTVRCRRHPSHVASSHTLGEGTTGSPPSNYVGGGTSLDVHKDLCGLNLSTVPKVFIECGNMRDGRDTVLLASDAWRQKAAHGIETASLTSWAPSRSGSLQECPRPHETFTMSTSGPLQVTSCGTHPSSRTRGERQTNTWAHVKCPSGCPDVHFVLGRQGADVSGCVKAQGEDPYPERTPHSYRR